MHTPKDWKFNRWITWDHCIAHGIPINGSENDFELSINWGNQLTVLGQKSTFTATGL